MKMRHPRAAHCPPAHGRMTNTDRATPDFSSRVGPVVLEFRPVLDDRVAPE